MEYLDNESTLPDVNRTFFRDFKFHQMEQVTSLIKNIPETPYEQMPPGVTQDKDKSGPSNK